MKGFVIFTALVIFAFISVTDYIGSGKLLQLADKHPDRRGTATALYYVARYYDLFEKPQIAVQYYERIVNRYPKSRYGMEAHFGLANCLERTKEFRRAVEEYEKFQEIYPNSKYKISVRNNIEILKFR